MANIEFVLWRIWRYYKSIGERDKPIQVELSKKQEPMQQNEKIRKTKLKNGIISFLMKLKKQIPELKENILGLRESALNKFSQSKKLNQNPNVDWTG